MTTSVAIIELKKPIKFQWLHATIEGKRDCDQIQIFGIVFEEVINIWREMQDSFITARNSFGSERTVS